MNRATWVLLISATALSLACGCVRQDNAEKPTTQRQSDTKKSAPSIVGSWTGKSAGGTLVIESPDKFRTGNYRGTWSQTGNEISMSFFHFGKQRHRVCKILKLTETEMAWDDGRVIEVWTRVN